MVNLKKNIKNILNANGYLSQAKYYTFGGKNKDPERGMRAFMKMALKTFSGKSSIA